MQPNNSQTSIPGPASANSPSDPAQSDPQPAANPTNNNSNNIINPPPPTTNAVASKPIVISRPKPKVHTFSVKSLLNDNNNNNNNNPNNQQKEPVLSVMSLLNDKTPMQVQAPRVPATAVAIRRPRTPQIPATKPQGTLPQPSLVTGSDNESWYLRCFCDIKNELGFMIQCEKCLNWQHAACINITQTTLPNNYTCPICAGKYIRCQCGENMNYKLPLIKCSKCGYYVHKRCEGLDPGPYFSANHVCTQCGGTPCQPPDVKLPLDTPFKNKVVTITQEVIDELHPSILSAPFASLLTTEFLDHDVSAFQFCEAVYNTHRAFFYLTHNTMTSYSMSKKRRGDVSFSFFKAVFYVLDVIFGMSQDVALQIFNSLSTLDIYIPFSMPTTLLQNNTNPIEFSDPAALACKSELEKSKHTPELTQVSFPNDLVLKRGVLMCQSALQPDQLIGVASGLIGLIEEFCYDNGADSHYYAISGTKFVLDARKMGAQLIHNFRRSLSPNCVLKLFKFNGLIYAGIFAGVSDVNGISRRTRREKFALPPDVELTLPLDFAPATIEELSDYMNWHLDDIELSNTTEPPSSPPPQQAQFSAKSPRASSPPKHVSRPSREERDGAAAMRQLERKKKRKQKEEKEQKLKNKRKLTEAKRTRGGSIKHNVDIPDSTLFAMMKQTVPEQYLFKLQPTEEEEIEDESEEIILNEKDIFNGDVDCGFLDDLMNAEIRPFAPIKIENPIDEMCELIQLDGFN
ncbi:PHD-finger family protein [Tritrichomonas foetus]|uniref:PHD-finger family protein n=1 Tax=Tritrichomonas foetus TaxID=1144522 RepID=A0A1J4JGD3_9EUKA|nr:PHD-finger family protein [Tritrichomonas foetus]|eukprot:OHS96707.1 PHD-finger family protein [Tritrichomonas foetus]